MNLSRRPGLARPGLVIAILGVDGSGKSSVQRALCESLRANGQEVVIIYFGSGDGPVSVSRKLLSIAGRFRHYVKNKIRKQIVTEAVSESTRDSLTTSRSGLRFTLDSLFVSGERKKTAARLRRARRRGALVITDRFPQVQDANGMDGPRLHYLQNSRSILQRVLARLEYRRYEEATKVQPDLAIVLGVRKEVSLERSGFHSPQAVEARIESLNRIQFPNSGVVYIDANQAFESVLRQVKLCVSELLASEDR